jgi:hypothetical protein
MVNYFTTRVKLHGQWGPRQEASVHWAYIMMPDCLLGSQAQTWQVPGMVLGVTFVLFGFAWLLSLLLAPSYGLRLADMGALLHDRHCHVPSCCSS